MSRIGNKPVQIPAGVEVAVNGNNVVVKGPKGQLELDVFEKLAINVEDNVLTVSRPDDERETRARHGLTRAHPQHGCWRFRGLREEARARRRRLPRAAEG